MYHHLLHRCTLALLLAFSLGLAAAVWGWGPIGLSPVLVLQQGAPLFAQASFVAAIALTGLVVWAQWVLARGQRRVSDVSWPWRLVLALIAVRAGLGAAQYSASNEVHLMSIQVATQLSHAALAVLLCWGWLAERFSACRPLQVALPLCATLLAVAWLWWYFVPAASGDATRGDARLILLLQLLPLVVLLAGVLHLPGRLLACGESMWLAAAYGLIWWCTWGRAVMEPTNLVLQVVGRPWLLFGLLSAMALILVNSGLRNQRERLRSSSRPDRRGSAPAWLAHFRLDALAASNRRSNS